VENNNQPNIITRTQTVPLKWKLPNLGLDILDPTGGVTVRSITCPVTPGDLITEAESASVPADAIGTLQYDTDQYIFGFSAKVNALQRGCYAVTVKLAVEFCAAGTQHTAVLLVKK
jgi:hypothetical protein